MAFDICMHYISHSKGILSLSVLILAQQGLANVVGQPVYLTDL